MYILQKALFNNRYELEEQLIGIHYYKFRKKYNNMIVVFIENLLIFISSYIFFIFWEILKLHLKRFRYQIISFKHETLMVITIT